MTQSNTAPNDERSSARARAELRRLAEEQGVRPLSFDEMLGDSGTGDPVKEDVDDFLELLREWRTADTSRGVE